MQRKLKAKKYKRINIGCKRKIIKGQKYVQNNKIQDVQDEKRHMSHRYIQNQTNNQIQKKIEWITKQEIGIGKR